MAQKPDYLDRKGFVCLILDQALDKPVTIPAYRVGAGNNGLEFSNSTPQQPPLPTDIQSALPTTAVDSSSAQEIETTKKKEVANSKKSRAKRTKGCDDFETFWSKYQSAPSKANGQSKAKAWEVWQQVVEFETPARLIEAIDKAISDIEYRNTTGAFVSPLPDCFRWLRDEQYAVHLESHQTANKYGASFL